MPQAPCQTCPCQAPHPQRRSDEAPHLVLVWIVCNLTLQAGWGCDPRCLLLAGQPSCVRFVRCNSCSQGNLSNCAALTWMPYLQIKLPCSVHCSALFSNLPIVPSEGTKCRDVRHCSGTEGSAWQLKSWITGIALQLQHYMRLCSSSFDCSIHLPQHQQCRTVTTFRARFSSSV